MSVLASKRSQSPLMTLDNACYLRRDLTIYMLKYFCNEKLDKNKNDLNYSKDVITVYRNSVLYLLKELLSYLARANAIYPTTLADIDRREMLQKKALEVCADLQTELNSIVLIYSNQVNGLLSFADRIGNIVAQIKNWKKANKKFAAKIQKEKALSCLSTNFCNCNNNGNANNNSASNSDNGVAPDFKGSN